MARRSRNHESCVRSRAASSEHRCQVVVLQYLERDSTRRTTHRVHVVAKDHPRMSTVALATTRCTHVGRCQRELTGA